MTIWCKATLKELTALFCLVVFSFFFLFSLIDYAAHAKLFSDTSLATGNIFFYYLLQFSKRLDLFCSVAFLVAVAKVQLAQSTKKELLAMVSAGTSLKRLTLPYLLFAMALCVVALINAEYGQPFATHRLNTFEKVLFSKTTKGHPVYTLPLEDDGLFVYQRSDGQCLFDAFWIKSADEILRIKRLDLDSPIPLAHFVDHLVRNESNAFVKKTSYKTLLLKELSIAENASSSMLDTPENWPLTTLWRPMQSQNLFSAKEKSDHTLAIDATFLDKLLSPLVFVLIVFALSPFCLGYARATPTFLIFGSALFGFLAFTMSHSAALILAKAGALPAIVCIPAPLVLGFLIFGWRYARI